MRKIYGLCLFSFLLLTSCQSSFLKLEKDDDLKLKSDIDQKVVVVDEDHEVPKVESTSKKQTGTPPPLFKKKPAPKKVVKAGGKTVVAPAAPVEPEPPSIEDTEGFQGRRPLKDPFRVGEKITHGAYYNLFGFTAANLTLETLPFVNVNGRKAYQFVINLKSTGMFNSFYSLDDKVVTLVDYEQWLPRLFTLHVKESSQLREGRSYFDFENLKATYEEKKVTKKKGKEEKKQEWDILPYSQNVFSVIYYMRLFAWRDGKTYQFRVADEEQNLIFTAKVVEREELSTKIGKMKAIKIKPQIILKGNFKPVGDIYVWLSDDERRLPLRIESKIKIGTIVSEITDYQPGPVP